ncbi:MAG: hypothetical protein AAGG48_23865 [Planctomycetota bacterium]
MAQHLVADLNNGQVSDRIREQMFYRSKTNAPCAPKPYWQAIGSSHCPNVIRVNQGLLQLISYASYLRRATN